MKCIFLISFFILSLSAISSNEECDITKASEALNLATSLGVPNCVTTTNLIFARRGRSQPLCESCLVDFEKKYTGRISGLSKNEIQKKAFIASAEEYKKSLVSNIVNAVQIRGLPSTGASFSASQKSCSLKSRNDYTSGCSSKAGRELLSNSPILRQIEDQIANEVARLVSPQTSFNPKPSLLESTTPQCEFLEKDVLLFSSLAVEESFTPELMSKLVALDPSKFTSVSRMILDNGGLPIEFSNDFLQSLSLHPILKTKITNPENFISFLKTVPQPYNSESFKAALYTEENGKKLDNDMADACSAAFNNFKKAVCSSDFEKGEIDLEPFKNLPKISENEIKASVSELAAPESLLSENLELLSLCKTQFKGPTLSSLLEGITPNLQEQYKEMNYSVFSGEKFTQDIGKTRDAVCESSSQSCEGQETFKCDIFRRFEASKNPQSLEAKLAHSSNSEINSLLRSMIGDTSKIPLQTRQILIQEGILPGADGNLVARPEVSEREPGYFSNAHSAQTRGSTVTSNQAVNSRVSTPQVNNSQTSNSAQANRVAAQPLPDFSDLLNKSDSRLEEVQNELMRRLSALPDQRPATQAQARQIARESFKAQNKPLTSGMENALASRMMAGRAPVMMQAPAPQGDNSNFSDVASTSTETAAEKYKKDGMNRALADMQGARGGAAAGAAGASAGGRGPASGGGSAESSTAPLTTVALSLTEDPRVSLNQVLADKINTNDPETQVLKVLVKSQKDFILQVKSVNFKVVFDDSNRMNILLESGDRTEAQRLRPQLEMFMRRLSQIR